MKKAQDEIEEIKEHNPSHKQSKKQTPSNKSSFMQDDRKILSDKSKQEQSNRPIQSSKLSHNQSNGQIPLNKSSHMQYDRPISVNKSSHMQSNRPIITDNSSHMRSNRSASLNKSSHIQHRRPMQRDHSSHIQPNIPSPFFNDSAPLQQNRFGTSITDKRRFSMPHESNQFKNAQMYSTDQSPIYFNTANQAFRDHTNYMSPHSSAQMSGYSINSMAPQMSMSGYPVNSMPPPPVPMPGYEYSQMYDLPSNMYDHRARQMYGYQDDSMPLSIYSEPQVQKDPNYKQYPVPRLGTPMTQGQFDQNYLESRQLFNQNPAQNRNPLMNQNYIAVEIPRSSPKKSKSKMIKPNSHKRFKVNENSSFERENMQSQEIDKYSLTSFVSPHSELNYQNRVPLNSAHALKVAQSQDTKYIQETRSEDAKREINIEDSDSTKEGKDDDLR